MPETNNTLVYSYTPGNRYPPPMIQYEPVRWIAYLLCAVFPLLAVRVLVVAKQTRALWLCTAAVASILMFVSLLLRGAMGRDSDDAFRMYETETALHLCAGYVLVGVLMRFAAEWVGTASQGTMGLFLTHTGIGYTAAAVVCTCVGIPLMFDASEAQRVSGYKLVSAAAIASIGLAALAAILTLYHVKRGGGSSQRGAAQVSVVGVPALLLLVWMSFALARVSLPMDNVANTSDAMFYCLSVLPAVGAVAVWTGQAEEFLGPGTDDDDSRQAVSNSSAGVGSNSGDVAAEHDMQGVTRVPTPCGSKDRVAVGAGISAFVVGVQHCRRCNCGGPGSTVLVTASGLCAKCDYEAMLQQAMHRYV
ncbi:hypothetical protein FB645_000828 [Coemansia sp. IMI 203386]|nr:hypothetical protein FB645_000828 [Coemansia sp. IMI 203386]